MHSNSAKSSEIVHRDFWKSGIIRGKGFSCNVHFRISLRETLKCADSNATYGDLNFAIRNSLIEPAVG